MKFGARVRPALILLGIFAVAIALRWDMAYHFGHIDDIGVAGTLKDAAATFTPEVISQKIEGGSVHHPGLAKLFRPLNATVFAGPMRRVLSFARTAFAVPSIFTYAPLQFVATATLLRGNHDYRTTLFLGRLPSWLASILAIWVVVLIGRKLWGPEEGPTLLAATLVAVSAEMVVYSKQMESYTIGVLALAVLLLVLIRLVDVSRPSPTLRGAIWIGVIATLASYAQYQALLSVPAFIAAWFFCRRSRNDVRAIAVAGTTWGLLVAPLYIVFLRRLGRSGIMWNAGPHDEFVFAPPHTPTAVIARAFTFFPRNAFLSFEATMSPVAEWHILYRATAVCLAVLAVVGIIALARSSDVRQRAVFLFASGIAATWTAFIVAHRLTLSPTRHSLILLPIGALCVAAGMRAITQRSSRHREIPSLALAVFLMVAAISGMPRTFSDRRDPLDEQELVELVTARRVSAILSYDWTQAVRLMPTVLSRAAIFEQLDVLPGAWEKGRAPANLDRLLFLSIRGHLTTAWYDSLRSAVNADSSTIAAGLSMPARSEYQVVFNRAIRSGVEVDISRRTENGTNELFITVMERRPAVRE